MIFKEDHIQQILRHADECAPEECCGLLIGSSNQVDNILPSLNMAKDNKTKQFELDPKVRFHAHRTFGEDKVMGFYHSHPNGLEIPSETDKKMVYEPHLVWVIVANHTLRAFKFNEVLNDFEEIAIQINS